MSEIRKALAQRLARGEISEQEYDRLIVKLAGADTLSPEISESAAPAAETAAITEPPIQSRSGVAEPPPVPVQPLEPATSSFSSDHAALERSADGLWRRSIGVYFGCVLGLTILFVLTPLGDWFASQIISMISVFLTEFRTNPAEQSNILRGLAVLFIAVCLYNTGRSLFRRIGPRVAVDHPVNRSLQAPGVDPQMRAVTLMALVAKRSRGWVKFHSTATGLSVAPGGYLRGFLLVWVIVAAASGRVSFEDSLESALSSGENGLADLLVGNDDNGLKQLRLASERAKHE